MYQGININRRIPTHSKWLIALLLTLSMGCTGDRELGEGDTRPILIDGGTVVVMDLDRKESCELMQLGIL